MKEIKVLSQKFTCDFFKEKASDLQTKLTDESNKIYDHFDETRDKYFKEQKRCNDLIKIMVRQERIINDLKTFQVTVLEEIFKKVERADPSVVRELLSKLPTKKQYSKSETL